MTVMKAEIQMLSNESASGFEKENMDKMKKLNEGIKAKKKNMTDTEKKLVGVNK